MVMGSVVMLRRITACVIAFLVMHEVRAAGTCDQATITSFSQCIQDFGTGPVWTSISSQANNTNAVGMSMVDAVASQLNSMCPSVESGTDKFINALKCVGRVVDLCADVIPGLDMYKDLFNAKGFAAGIEKMCADKQTYLDNAVCMASKEAVMTQCLTTKLGSSTQGINIANQNMTQIKWSMCRIYDASHSCYGSLSSCSQALANSVQGVFKLMMPDHCKPNYRSPARITVGVYGDPHLRTADQSWVTCSAPGEQIYLKNKAFEVKGTNVAFQGASGNPPPTTIQSITVTFYPEGEDTAIGSYTASGGNLPTTFPSGETSMGSGSSVFSIQEVFSGSAVSFRYSSVGMVLFLRKRGQTYFFTLRMAEVGLSAAQGLLATGCPDNQTINRALVRRRRKRAVSQTATTSCASVKDANMKDVCQYDVTVTNDNVEFASMAKDGETDTTSAEALDGTMIANAMDFSGNSAVGIKSQQFITILCIALTFLSSLTYM